MSVPETRRIRRKEIRYTRRLAQKPLRRALERSSSNQVSPRERATSGLNGSERNRTQPAENVRRLTHKGLHPLSEFGSTTAGRRPRREHGAIERNSHTWFEVHDTNTLHQTSAWATIRPKLARDANTCSDAETARVVYTLFFTRTTPP